jgi:hypothetical protein
MFQVVETMEELSPDRLLELLGKGYNPSAERPLTDPGGGAIVRPHRSLSDMLRGDSKIAPRTTQERVETPQGRARRKKKRRLYK